MSLGDAGQGCDHTELFRERTPNSREFHERAAETTPLGVESNVRGFDPYPFYADSAEGSYVYDIDDNEYE